MMNSSSKSTPGAFISHPHRMTSIACFPQMKGALVSGLNLPLKKIKLYLLTLKNLSVKPEEWAEVNAGWVSVLMGLKAAVDHGIDLRTHDPRFSWDKGYVEN